MRMGLCRSDPLAAWGGISIMSALSSSSAMAWSRSDLPNSISTASTKGRPAQLSSFAASLSSFPGCHSATRNGPVPMGTPFLIVLEQQIARQREFGEQRRHGPLALDG